MNTGIKTIDADDESPLNGSQVADTIPPSKPDNGFLERWEALSASAIEELEEVCKLGLTDEEGKKLVRVSGELLGLAAAYSDVLKLAEEPDESPTSE